MITFSLKARLLQFSFLCLITLLGFAGVSPNENNKKEKLTWLQQHKQAAAATVLLNNQSGLVPLKDLQQKIASVNLGAANSSEFDSLLNKYTSVSSFSAVGVASDSAFRSLSDDLKFYSTIIVQAPYNAFQKVAALTFIQSLQKEKQVILALTGDASVLEKLDGFTAPIVWSENETPVTANYMAQLLFGGVPANGKLERTYSAKFKKGDGYRTSAIRIKYSLPEELGINSADLHEPIDSILAEMIQEQAAPGGVVMVVKDGSVIFNKAYGAHTYDNTRPTRIDDIFDLASVTKVSATTLAVMGLYEQQKINLDKPVGTYIPSTLGSTKAELKIKDILLHQAGLPAGVGLPTPADYVSKTYSEEFPLPAADSVFIRKDYFKEVVWPRMLNAKVTAPGKYVYSDLTMYFLKEVVERQSEQPLNDFVLQNFYAPLGMQTAGFLPLARFEKDRIVPTENDTYFRKTLLQGYVHDGGAAKLGGVSGHAGLFSTANDLAILYQMLLNGGTYGGIEYLSPKTVQLFTSRQSSVSRRGLGFDGFDPESKNGYPSKLASSSTYGHTGYTGTCVWVDPAQNLVYIFLSNRVYPKVSNKLISLRTRARVQDAIYQAIEKSGKASALKPVKG